MQSRIILISNDSNFFEYITPKLNLRKSDELFRFSFAELPDKLHLLASALLIINSENAEENTLELLNLTKPAVSLVFGYNDDVDFKVEVYKRGALGYVTPFMQDEEFSAKLTSTLSALAKVEKNSRYRDLLVKNQLITPNNEVYIDYKAMLDSELEKINQTSARAVLLAISPNEKTKFLLLPNQIETIILNCIRENDVLMSYATNKYFLLLYNTDVDSAQKIWEKIQKNIPYKLYAGIGNVLSKPREQIVNEVLNKLHEAINYDKENLRTEKNPVDELGGNSGNFKSFRKDFNKKIEQIVSPVFYHVQQTNNDKLFGMRIEQCVGEGYGLLSINGRNANAMFKITCPGFSKINIDISYKTANHTPSKRISIEPDELEAGFLEDLLEQFIQEFKKEINDDNT